jgi:hypothetical protein
MAFLCAYTHRFSYTFFAAGGCIMCHIYLSICFASESVQRSAIKSGIGVYTKSCQADLVLKKLGFWTLSIV